MTPRWLPACCGLLLAAVAALAVAAEIDPAASQVGFSVRTRWGKALLGRFHEYHGEIEELSDGRHRVHLSLATRTVEIVGHASYTRFTRGSGFFDAARYPKLEFVSDPYGPELLQRGGALPGMLTIRGVSRREVFTIDAAHCPRPARDCDVVGAGSVRRSDYGIDRWNFALSDKVRFSLRVRVRGERGA